MKKYNVVLIGCGRMGEAYLEELYLKENLCLYGVADLNSERAAYFARKYQAKSWKTDYMEYMRDPAVDIIIAATYTNTHLTILKACASFG